MAVSVDDIASMSDIELGQFIVQNRAADGSFGLLVDGWDKLSKETRTRLGERLQAQQRALAEDPTAQAQARPLDLDQIDARLRELSRERSQERSQERSLQDPSSRDRSLSTPRRTLPPTPDDEKEIKLKSFEVEAYNDLVQDGGRPLYPISLIDKIFQDPEGHFELLQPWRFGWRTRTPWKYPDSDDKPREVISRQLERWQDFRKWQNDNRDNVDYTEYPAYVEKAKRFYKRLGHVDYDCLIHELEVDPDYLQREWNHHENLRHMQACHCREFRGGNGFAGYVEAVRHRLSRHQFARPFELKQDPKQQDRLTEWIEYLNFEYWWLDRYTESMERLRPAHDKAWQELVDAGALKPGMTMESVRTDEFAMQASREDNEARNAVKRAKMKARQAYALTQSDADRLNIPAQERIRRMKAADDEVDAVITMRDSVIKRNDRVTDFIRGTFDFHDAKKDAARHTTLVQWVLDQVPLVESEMAQSEAAKAKPKKASSGTKRRRLALDGDDLGERSPKQQKLDSGRSARSTAPAQASPPKLLRRSARIAALAAKSSTASSTPPQSSSRRVLRPRPQNNQQHHQHSVVAPKKGVGGKVPSREDQRQVRQVGG